MKIFLIGTGITIGLVLIGVGMWLILSPHAQQQTTPPPTTILPGSSTITTIPIQNKTVSNQTVSAGTQPVIAKSMLDQIENSNLITLRGTAVVSDYALQLWDDENKGGEALMHYTTTKGWELVSLGGGSWSVESLTELGVPAQVALQLVAGRN